MFEYLKGMLEDKITGQSGFYLIVEVNGIAYRLEVPEIDYNNSPEVSSEIKIYTSLIHKEDSMFLCGFLQKETRDIFKILTSVSGVGTKMALALLGRFDACDLISIVINEDYKELTLAKGVGTKLAQKIILELRDKLIKANIAPVKPDDPLIETQASKDTFSVLQSLGYEYDEIKSSIAVVSSRLSNPNDSEELLRECLKHLSM